jgi:glycosyltransferase involved in cell wall biosynthesis
VGRLQPIKGLDTLLEAMTAVPAPACLLIVGGEHDERENAHGAALRHRLKALGLERRVRFLRALEARYSFASQNSFENPS